MEKIKTYVYGIRLFFVSDSQIRGATNFAWEKPILKSKCFYSKSRMILVGGSPHTSIEHRCGINMWKISYYKQHFQWRPWLANPNYDTSTTEYYKDCAYLKKSLWGSMVVPPSGGVSFLTLVRGSGKIVEHEIGYRVKNAEVLCILAENPYLQKHIAQLQNDLHGTWDEILRPTWDKVPVSKSYQEFHSILDEFKTKEEPLPWNSLLEHFL